MSPLELALAACAVLTIALALYSLAHYFCAFVFLAADKRPRTFSGAPATPVTVLVPAKDEGDRALRVITSLVEQDHAGELEILLLVKDELDTAVPMLSAHYPGVSLSGAVGAQIELTRAPRRRVTLCYTGSDPKSAKINWAVPKVTTPHTAILDCDHQAHPNWVSSCLLMLKERGARMIQARREPISAKGLFALWDSLHQHIGCELYNIAFTKLGLGVFFTGTTAVIETALLRDRPLSSSITEDIDFSYGLFFDGVRAIANPYTGSSEEVSPDLYSFLARRRRWANGHTQAFFHHLWGGRGRPLRLADRLQFILHGSHYLVSIGVFWLHLVIGLIFIRTFSTTSQVSAVLSSLILAATLARTQRTIGLKLRAVEVLVLFAWLFPAIVIAMNLSQALLLDDASRTALPIAYALQAIGLVGLAAPLVLLLVGLAGLRQLGAGTSLVVLLSYPLAFYLDLSGVLLGMADWATGAARWRAVSRAPAGVRPSQVASLLPTAHIRQSWTLRAMVLGVPAALRTRTRNLMKPSRWIPIALIVVVFAAGAMFAPSTRVEAPAPRCERMDFDGEPWIVPAKKLGDFCSEREKTVRGDRTGTLHSVRTDPLTSLDESFWDRMDKTFFCNLSMFSPDNVRHDAGGMKLVLEPRAIEDRSFAAGSIVTKDAPDARFLYGRFSAKLRPAKTSGTITALFLYRFDPWQEIDMEFVGKDTTKLLLNVYYNPGEEGDKYNYGHLGTPVMVDLGFDASLETHEYTIEWESSEIRWLVDGRLIHARRAGMPTPIPHLPMRFFLNHWPICSEKLAGPFSLTEGQSVAEVSSVSIGRWYPSPLPQFLERIFARGGGDWRSGADWIQRK